LPVITRKTIYKNKIVATIEIIDPNEETLFQPAKASG
jgi:hypothetical protein